MLVTEVVNQSCDLDFNRLRCSMEGTQKRPSVLWLKREILSFKDRQFNRRFEISDRLFSQRTLVYCRRISFCTLKGQSVRCPSPRREKPLQMSR